MIVSIRTAHGKYLSAQPDGTFETRDALGPWERFEVVDLDAPVTPQPPQPKPPVPPANLDHHAWFMALVAGRPFGQQTLLDLEPVLNANGWELTPANVAGDRTKVHPPGGPWTRVGFGEGHWVWIPQGVLMPDAKGRLFWVPEA